MSLNASIAKLQLKNLPDSIVKRVLKHENVLTLAEMGSAYIEPIGTLHFADIREALSNCEFGVSKEILCRSDGRTIVMVRLETGLHAARYENGPKIVLPELALLDPDATVRLRAHSEIVSRSKPCWPNCSTWQTILIQRTLSDSEFGRVIFELEHIANYELGRISSAMARDSFRASDLIPTARSYYESLIGRIAATETVNTYIASVLMPHLATAISADSLWGLRCLRGSSLSSKVDWAAVTASATPNDVFAALTQLGPGPTPFSRLLTYQISQSFASIDPRFSALANEALEELIEHALPDQSKANQDGLFLAFMRLTLTTISLNEEFALAPTYWRRLAAFAHATVLLEAIDFPTKDTEQLIAWCDAQQSLNANVVGILDLIRSPLWNAELYTATNLSVLALIRAINWNPSEVDKKTDLTSDQADRIGNIRPQFPLAFAIPDPFSGKRDRRDENSLAVLSEEHLHILTGDTPPGLILDSEQIWEALIYSSRIFAFSEELRIQVRALAKRFQADEPNMSDAWFAILASAAELAVLISDEELAGILANYVLRAAPHTTSPNHSINCAIVLVIASGAVRDWHGSLAWAAERLEALAYQVPRGNCSKALANWIETVQKYIPLKERKWGKAWILARSAIN